MLVNFMRKTYLLLLGNKLQSPSPVLAPTGTQMRYHPHSTYHGVCLAYFSCWKDSKITKLAKLQLLTEEKLKKTLQFSKNLKEKKQRNMIMNNGKEREKKVVKDLTGHGK
jgi:hypothetical protein